MPPSPPTLESDEAYQEHALPGVSRTFALTIPELPGSTDLNLPDVAEGVH